VDGLWTHWRSRPTKLNKLCPNTGNGIEMELKTRSGICIMDLRALSAGESILHRNGLAHTDNMPARWPKASAARCWHGTETGQRDNDTDKVKT